MPATYKRAFKKLFRHHFSISLESLEPIMRLMSYIKPPPLHVCTQREGVMAFDNLLSVNSADVNDYGALFLRP